MEFWESREWSNKLKSGTPDKNTTVKRFSLPEFFPFYVSDNTFEIRYNGNMENSVSEISRMDDVPGGGPNAENTFSGQNTPPTSSNYSGRSTTQSTGTTDTYYIYSFDNKLMAEYDSSGKCVKNYIYLGSKLIAEYHPEIVDVEDSKYYYHMADQVNSTRIITDGNGDVVHSAAYGPFGETQKTWTNTYEPKLKFSGKERETYSGLDYFGARYYDHSTYRFNSVDPIINKDEALVNPQLWNLYAYCRNSPITYHDPDGRFAVSAFVYGLVQYGIPVLAAALAIKPLQKTIKKIQDSDLSSKSGDLKSKLEMTGNAFKWLGSKFSKEKKAKGKKQKKTSKSTPKERALDKPSWSVGKQKEPGENSEDYTNRLMNEKYPDGWEMKGNQKREFSKIKKWANRHNK